MGVTVDLGDDHVATVTISRPPENFFDLELVTELADAFDELDRTPDCRAIVLRGAGKHFCAGAKFASDGDDVIASADGERNPLYAQAVRLVGGRVPVVAAVQGAAIGGGLGLAMVADFRFGAPEARFAANFARLGLHHGFGLTVTLPAVVGQQRALDLLYTGRRVRGEEALEIGLVDRLVSADRLLDEARAYAAEIAGSAPLAVREIRATMRGDLAERLRAATDREHQTQRMLRDTRDFTEGVGAYAERRPPRFEAR
ncbi:MAG TPA: enoyl-CoA hydratase/isomerase family protein [Pseudonocardiaceae bacterium]|nr:enoyl-CoA hydratase/isomerase family protein [Pseudonocardiaceae bacterium]